MRLSLAEIQLYAGVCFKFSGFLPNLPKGLAHMCYATQRRPFDAQELCYVAQNYDEEMDKPLEKASCDVRGEGVFDLDQQRFQAPEILFQPALCGRWAAHGAVPFSVADAESEKVQRLVFALRGV